ncbi:3'(2'),5'-bisphosphate nucleotidase [Azomonas agilis]|uniref:3'(2'),5'-bisphosphate nucleotidase CysQ n=1 Tax=Azomonas agilis TaxID=116849 RepID=A0A562J2S1_9GAMM|nr:3'(2'),5'-bisphosphate nucleotidase CysQ [Azomonas agilis]TWH77516.1 3'(2'),5'-bisphosphate nucleotidase [Azomonas agilis]
MNSTVFEAVIALAQQAGSCILPYWRTGLQVQEKSDASPVTAADMAAHQCILSGLRALDPSIPVLSEEDCSIPLHERQHWTRWWLVDPLDGTKEFIQGSEEFTVNIALIEQGQAVWGVVGLPAKQAYYYGGSLQQAAWYCSPTERHALKIPVQPHTLGPSSIIASRRHTNPAQEQLLHLIQETLGTPELRSAGSSLKFCLVAEGQVECYPRLSPTAQWDTAAAQAVLEGAGGVVLTLDGSPLTYEARQDFINPAFLALPAKAPWRDQILALACSSQSFATAAQSKH